MCCLCCLCCLTDCAVCDVCAVCAVCALSHGHAEIEGNVNVDANAECAKTKCDFAAFSLKLRAWKFCDLWDAAELELIQQRIGVSYPRSTLDATLSPEDDLQSEATSTSNDIAQNVSAKSPREETRRRTNYVNASIPQEQIHISSSAEVFISVKIALKNL